MHAANINRRSALARLLGTAAILPLASLPARVWAAAAAMPPRRLSDGTLTIVFDDAQRSSLWFDNMPLTVTGQADALVLSDGRVLHDFDPRMAEEQPIDGPHGAGRRIMLRGACGAIERVQGVTFLDRYPGLVLIDTNYRNAGTQPVAVAGWRTATYDVLDHQDGAWSFAGASYPDRRDWLQPVLPRVPAAQLHGHERLGLRRRHASRRRLAQRWGAGGRASGDGAAPGLPAGRSAAGQHSHRHGRRQGGSPAARWHAGAAADIRDGS